ncbi:MAG: RraA family protein [Candidatus Bathyarchaeia archaeon]|nr:RraA family protein [Candidatus Bathyarchaeota archaeon]
MFDLNLVERYKLVRVADVVDALDRFGIHENALVSHEIGPIYPGIKMAGFAITVQARKVQEEMPLISPEEYDRYAEEWYRIRANYDNFMRLAGPGTVIAINSAGCINVGFWGSMIALVAKSKSVEGVVLDGGCRDIWEIQRIRFPVFCRSRGRTEVVGRLEIPSENVNISILIGGVTVNPGDVIVGDDDGVVVVPRKIAHRVLERAEKQLMLDRNSQKPYLEKLGINLP